MEIKFKGKRKDNGEWVIGDLFRTPEDAGTYFEPPSQELTWFITNSYLITHEPHEVMPETVGQFTGLYDSQGKEIYVGDKYYPLYGKEVYSVYYYEGAFTGGLTIETSEPLGWQVDEDTGIVITDDTHWLTLI